jgi:hypothetical protein
VDALAPHDLGGHRIRLQRRRDDRSFSSRNHRRRRCTDVTISGAALCLGASRLARTGRDRHHRIDLCAHTRALVIDPDGIYESAIGASGIDVSSGIAAPKIP